MERGHAEALLPMVAELMKDAGLEFAAIDRVAAACGPGSFTGLRIGLAAARGLALALGCPAVGVSRLEALAADYFAGQTGNTAALAVAIDAHRGQLYLQVFAPNGTPLGPAGAVDVENAAGALPMGDTLALGDGAQLLQQAAAGTGRQVTIVRQDRETAARIACIGSGCDPSAHPPAPLYLRAPDAKRPSAGVVALDARPRPL